MGTHGRRPENYVLVQNTIRKILSAKLVRIFFHFEWKIAAAAKTYANVIRMLCPLLGKRKGAPRGLACLKSVVSDDSTNAPRDCSVTTTNQYLAFQKR